MPSALQLIYTNILSLAMNKINLLLFLYFARLFVSLAAPKILSLTTFSSLATQPFK